MLHGLIDACFRQRWLVMSALVGVVALGIYVALNLSVDAFPDLTNNQITVITEAGPMSPTEVESQVTYPIETALMGIPRTVQLRSISKLGLSIITVVLDDSVDLYFGRQLVNERLREVRGRLPQGLEPTLGPSPRPLASSINTPSIAPTSRYSTAKHSRTGWCAPNSARCRGSVK